MAVLWSLWPSGLSGSLAPQLEGILESSSFMLQTGSRMVMEFGQGHGKWMENLGQEPKDSVPLSLLYHLTPCPLGNSSELWHIYSNGSSGFWEKEQTPGQSSQEPSCSALWWSPNLVFVLFSPLTLNSLSQWDLYFLTQVYPLSYPAQHSSLHWLFLWMRSSSFCLDDSHSPFDARQRLCSLLHGSSFEVQVQISCTS